MSDPNLKEYYFDRRIRYVDDDAARNALPVAKDDIVFQRDTGRRYHVAEEFLPASGWTDNNAKNANLVAAGNNGVCYNEDRTKMMIARSTSIIEVYNLSVPGDASTLVFDFNLTPPSTTGTFSGVYWNESDGLIVIITFSDFIAKYSYTGTLASGTSLTKDGDLNITTVSAAVSAPTQLHVDSTKQIMMISDLNTDKIHRFDLPSANDFLNPTDGGFLDYTPLGMGNNMVTTFISPTQLVLIDNPSAFAAYITLPAAYDVSSYGQNGKTVISGFIGAGTASGAGGIYYEEEGILFVVKNTQGIIQAVNITDLSWETQDLSDADKQKIIDNDEVIFVKSKLVREEQEVEFNKSLIQSDTGARYHSLLTLREPSAWTDATAKDLISVIQDTTAVCFNEDRTRLMTLRSSNSSLYVYDLATPGDVSTADEAFSISTLTSTLGTPSGVYWSEDDGLIVIVTTSDYIAKHSYSGTLSASTTITKDGDLDLSTVSGTTVLQTKSLQVAENKKAFIVADDSQPRVHKFEMATANDFLNPTDGSFINFSSVGLSLISSMTLVNNRELIIVDGADTAAVICLEDEYDMGANWRLVGTASLTGFGVTTPGSRRSGIILSPDDGTFYVCYSAIVRGIKAADLSWSTNTPNYETARFFTGRKWHDGRKIYGKVIQLSTGDTETLLNTHLNTTPHGITDLNELIMYRGTFISGPGSHYTIPFINRAGSGSGDLASYDFTFDATNVINNSYNNGGTPLSWTGLTRGLELYVEWIEVC